jgi:5-methyltetrahydropteroyltriglutamate--homocysteine methyltransferase
MRARGEDPKQNFLRSIKADQALIANFPGVTFGIHLCRGNQRSMWHREGTYDAIAEQLFTELPYDRFLLEYDSPRAGGFEPLRFMPKGKIAVLGLISTKVPELEKIDDLKRRIDHPAGADRDQSAVRLRLRRGRQPDQRGRSAPQAGAGCGDRAAGLGIGQGRG